MTTRLFALAALLAGAATPAAAQPISADVACEPGQASLEYRCVFELTEGGAPLSGARFTVKPDMPSMPMAHNIAPVEASETGAPGTYESLFTLDMHGRWSLRLDVTEPRRDVVIAHWDFVPEGEAAAGHRAGAHGQGHGAHSGH